MHEMLFFWCFFQSLKDGKQIFSVCVAKSDDRPRPRATVGPTDPALPPGPTPHLTAPARNRVFHHIRCAAGTDLRGT